MGQYLINQVYEWVYFFFNSVLRPFQDYFNSYQTGQSVGGAKTGEPREKPPDTPASRTWLVSHVARAGIEPTPDTAVRYFFNDQVHDWGRFQKFGPHTRTTITP